VTTYIGSGTGYNTYDGTGTNNTLDYSQDPNGVVVDLATGAVLKDFVSPFLYVDNFSDIQNFVGSGGGNTTFESIGTGNYTFTGQGSNNTLDYSNDPNAVDISLKSNLVVKDFDPAFQYYDSDQFSDIQTFVGSYDGAGTNIFQSVGTGNYTFVGKGSHNALDYTDDPNGVIINLAAGAVLKNAEIIVNGIPIPFVYVDAFSDIQTFFGSSGGNTTFQSIGTGDYDFIGQGSNNTLSYANDSNVVTISLATYSVEKGNSYQDTFSDIQTFVGSGSGNFFQSIGTGDYTFTGQGNYNTLDYSNDPNAVTIDLATGTVGKGNSYQDTFTDFQFFVGNSSASNTIVFSGASNQYAIVDNTDGSVYVYDEVAGRNGAVELTNIKNLQFTDTTLNPSPSPPINDAITDLYVGYFNRAQDPGGEAYWAGRLQAGMSLNDIAQSYSVQPESTNLYPFLANPNTASTSSVQAFVAAVYENLFNRDPFTDGDSGGSYWVGQLQNQIVTVGTAILAIIYGAPSGSGDAQTVQNKVSVADFFELQVVSHNVQWSPTLQVASQTALLGVTSNTSTVTTAQDALLALV
jgi:hypothetical protein